jgi:uncharacterized protein (TIGR00297 family)
MIGRALAGFLLAGALAFGARFARSLSLSGAIAALAIGTVTATAGWSWAIVLITFFLTSSALSRFKRGARDARIGDVVEKGDERDAFQVFANGGVFAGCCIVAAATESSVWSAAALGALAGAVADTWATEIGSVFGGQPRSIVSFRRLAPGLSGGITAVGLGASVAGAAMLIGMARLTGIQANLSAVFAGGIAGSLADSLMGATVQERRWCDQCSRSTERRVHSCGATTRVVGGVPGARNDFVNVVCTIVGAAVAALLSF